MDINLHPANRDLDVIDIDTNESFELIGMQNSNIGVLSSPNLLSAIISATPVKHILKWIDFSTITFGGLTFELPEEHPGGLYAVDVVDGEMVLQSYTDSNTVSFVHVSKRDGFPAMFNKFTTFGNMRMFSSPVSFLSISSILSNEQYDYYTPLLGLPCLCLLSLEKHTAAVQNNSMIDITRDGFSASWLLSSVASEYYAQKKYTDRFFMSIGGEIQVMSYFLKGKTYTINLLGVALL